MTCSGLARRSPQLSSADFARGHFTVVFDGEKHLALASSKFPGMAERTCVVNAVSKTFKATGWRVGWVISPKAYTHAIRATHDQLVLQAPTPLQIGAEACLRLPDS